MKINKRCLKAGDQIGNITLQSTHELRHYGQSGNRMAWLCKCDCGNEIWVFVKHLYSEQVRHCGCKFIEQHKNSAFKIVLRNYKKHAKARGYEFDLKDNEFAIMTQQTCHYCGKVPSTVCKNAKTGSFTYNGIDRKDSLSGYSINNCVPCCMTCNRAKLDVTYNNFIDLVRKIHKHMDL
jgi:5-methylcytosine-specific restriction endonuclease McrA